MSIFKTLLRYAPGPVLATAMAMGSGCYSPEGTKVMGPADGIVTVAEAQVRQAAVQENSVTSGSNQIILDIMRDDLTAVKRYLADEGFSLPSLDELHVYTVKDHSELAKKWKDCGAALDSIPSSVYAFYCDVRSTIYQPKDPFKIFLHTLTHEIGHHFHPMDISNSASEFPAEAFRGFMDFFRWANDYYTSQLLADFPFPNRIPSLTSEPTVSGLGRYNAAMLSFIMACNEYDGNATLAFKEMLSGNKDTLRSRFQERADQYGAATGRELWHAAYERLLFESPGFQTWYEDTANKLDSYPTLPEAFVQAQQNAYNDIISQLPVWDSLKIDKH